MFLELGRHRRSTEQAIEELFHLDLVDNPRDGDLTVSKMADMHYIKRVVKELLRVRPPVGSGCRQVLRTMEIGVSVTLHNNASV